MRVLVWRSVPIGMLLVLLCALSCTRRPDVRVSCLRRLRRRAGVSA